MTTPTRRATFAAYVLLLGCASSPRPGAVETPALPHMCGEGVSPEGVAGDGCPEGYECRQDARGPFCEWVGTDWGGPGTDSAGEDLQ